MKHAVFRDFALDRRRMSGFALDRVPRIVQEPGLLGRLGELAKGDLQAGATVLLAVDPGLAPTGIADRAAASIREAGHEVVVFDQFQSDPTIAQVDAGVALARTHRAAAVIGVGGGSAMDVGKGIATVASGEAPTAHYGLCANPFPRRTLASLCVPTTSGTGSETTRTAVFADQGHAKIWFWGDEMKADLVVLDPELTTGLPPHLTAATGIDALVHAIEAATNANANAANNLYCHEAIRLVVRHLPQVMAAPGDVEARGYVQWAATLAGIAIDNCGTAIAHNIGHALASLRPVHHGRAVGLAMRATLAWNVEDDDGRFAAVAQAMGAGNSATALPDAFERLLRAVGVKVSLKAEGHDGITADQLAVQMRRPENAAMRRSNRRPSSDADLERFAAAVLEAE
jgi:alcohol dehydrogenase class IV